MAKTIKLSTLNNRFEKLHNIANYAEDIAQAIANHAAMLCSDDETEEQRDASMNLTEQLDDWAELFAPLASEMQRAESQYMDAVSGDSVRLIEEVPSSTASLTELHALEIENKLRRIGFYQIEGETYDQFTSEEVVNNIHSLYNDLLFFVDALESVDCNGIWSDAGEKIANICTSFPRADFGRFMIAFSAEPSAKEAKEDKHAAEPKAPKPSAKKAKEAEHAAEPKAPKTAPQMVPEAKETVSGKMKVLSIKQPWASIIACGLKDVENRTWNSNYRGRLLLHASSKKIPQNLYEGFPLEWINIIENAIAQGQLPPLEEMPLGAIVGYADMTDCVSYVTDSIWDSGEGYTKFVMENAHVFDEPITGVNGKLSIWEYDLGSGRSAHKVDLDTIRVEGQEVFVSLTPEAFANSLQNQRVSFFLTDTLIDALAEMDEKNEQKVVKKVDKITINLTDGTTKRFELPKGLEVINLVDADGEFITVPGLYDDDEPLMCFDMELGKEL